MSMSAPAACCSLLRRIAAAPLAAHLGCWCYVIIKGGIRVFIYDCIAFVIIVVVVCIIIVIIAQYYYSYCSYI